MKSRPIATRSRPAVPDPNRIRILGVDPGTLVVGYAVIEDDGRRLETCDYGVIRPPRRASIAARLLEIHRDLGEVMDEYRPDVLALERVFFGRSAPAAIRIGEGRGVVLVTASLRGIPVSEYAPAMVKKAVVGSGSAPKGQVQEMVRRVLGLDAIPEPEDAADALALCICHSNRRRIARYSF